jgi:hypothetical protein
MTSNTKQILDIWNNSPAFHAPFSNNFSEFLLLYQDAENEWKHNPALQNHYSQNFQSFLEAIKASVTERVTRSPLENLIKDLGEICSAF